VSSEALNGGIPKSFIFCIGGLALEQRRIPRSHPGIVGCGGEGSFDPPPIKSRRVEDPGSVIKGRLGDAVRGERGEAVALLPDYQKEPSW
jgi:hypothetical protein